MEPPTEWPHRPPGGRERWVDLGCGRRSVSGAYGLDAVTLPGVSIVARMDAPHLPFGDGRVARLFALNVLEHLDDLVGGNARQALLLEQPDRQPGHVGQARDIGRRLSGRREDPRVRLAAALV